MGGVEVKLSCRIFLVSLRWWQWNHDPFGSGAPSGAFTYELRFPGQFFDQGTKLHYNYFRD